MNGSIHVIVSISYTAFPNIRDLSLTWGPWIGGEGGVIVNAQLSGHIEVHISASPIVVNPTLTLTNLPVTITFGTDRSGNATVSPSQVIVAPVGPHGSVDGCGVFDWCDGLVRGPIESAVQDQLQSNIADQFTSALNASGPFSFGFMRAVVDRRLPLLRDPAGFLLPTIGQATPGGDHGVLAGVQQLQLRRGQGDYDIQFERRPMLHRLQAEIIAGAALRV